MGGSTSKWPITLPSPKTHISRLRDEVWHKQITLSSSVSCTNSNPTHRPHHRQTQTTVSRREGCGGAWDNQEGNATDASSHQSSHWDQKYSFFFNSLLWTWMLLLTEKAVPGTATTWRKDFSVKCDACVYKTVPRTALHLYNVNMVKTQR